MLPLSSILNGMQLGLRRLTPAALALIVASVLLHAEDAVPPPEELAPPSPREQLQKSADELAEQRKQLESEFDTTKRSLPKELAKETPRPKLLDLFHSELDARQSRGVQQLEQLRTNLQELEKALAKQKEENARKVQVKKAASPKPQEAEKAEGEKSPPAPPAAGLTGPQLPALDEMPTGAEPVDRLGLANNLYAMGNYKLALATYLKIPLAEAVPEDRVWIEYQLGCCNRNLGDIGEAEKHYRVVASRAQPEFLTEYSRWWLDSLQQRKQVEKALSEVRPALEAIEKQINEPKATTAGK